MGFVLFLSFVVNGKLFWGVDNMHLVEKELGNVDAAPLRLVRPPTSPQSATLTIYHDLASPWSFIGSTQVYKAVEKGSDFTSITTTATSQSLTRLKRLTFDWLIG